MNLQVDEELFTSSVYYTNIHGTRPQDDDFDEVNIMYEDNTEFKQPLKMSNNAFKQLTLSLFLNGFTKSKMSMIYLACFQKFMLKVSGILFEDYGFFFTIKLVVKVFFKGEENDTERGIIKLFCAHITL